jgi:hypothetical protein
MSETPSDDERVPISDVLEGLTIHPLEKSWTALDCLILIKCFDDEGRSTWAFRATQGLNREELLGALTVHGDLLKNRLVDEFDDDDEED